HRPPRAERFEVRPQLDGLQDLVGRRPAHPGSAKREDVDHADGLQAAERFTDRRLAGTEFARYLRLHDARVRRIAAGQDVTQQPVLDLVGQDTALDPAFEHGHSPSLARRSPLDMVRDTGSGTRASYPSLVAADDPDR